MKKTEPSNAKKTKTGDAKKTKTVETKKVQTVDNNKKAKPTDPHVEQQVKKQKKKRRMIFILLSVIIGVFVLGGVGAIVGIKMSSTNKSTASTYFEVVIDPIIVTSGGENHINGAERFVFGDNEESTYNTHIQAQLSYGQYIYYNYALNNQGTRNVRVSLSIVVDQQENANITYCINDGSEETATGNLLDIVSTARTQTSINVYIKINDLQQDAYVSGTLVLILTEVGGNNG